MNTTSTKQLGFTLVEMMIAVAILAILSVIAIPSYNRYIERSYQSQAHAELVAINSAFKTRWLKIQSGKMMRLKLSWMTLLPHTKAIKIWQTNTNTLLK